MLTTLFLLLKRLAYLLAGKDTAAKKIQTARTKYEAEVLNLRHLDKLLRGQLMFDHLKQQDKLTSENFKGNDYQLAGEPLTFSETTGDTSTEDTLSGGDASSRS